MLKMKLGTHVWAVIVFKRYSLFSRVDINPRPRTLACATSDRAMLFTKAPQSMNGVGGEHRSSPSDVRNQASRGASLMII